MTRSHLTPEVMARAREIVALYPQRRSALIPLCHLAQEQDGWLRPEAMADIAELCGVTAAEVRGTATFYDMLHTEPVGTYVVSVCTNIAWLLGGAQELLEHAESGVQVSNRYVGGQTAESFAESAADLSSGALADTVPHHGTLVRVRMSVGLKV